MTNNELALVSILGADTVIYLTLLYFFYVVKPVNDEQKEASKEDPRRINTDEIESDYARKAAR